MAGTSLLALIDDIAALLDDIAVMSKVAAKKTAGVLGDDLALNAQQVAGVQAERELPVVWAVAVGSGKNKLILVPAALIISAFMPWAITPLLMAGGAYLCFEGCEKIFHTLHHQQANKEHSAHDTPVRTIATSETELAALERKKIVGAIRTDFILSAEIVVITLGSVAEAPFLRQVAVLTVVAALMTIGVYGLVAGIVKLDDGGAYLVQRRGDSLLSVASRRLGHVILLMAPWLMKSLSVIGTVAMFLVGGGILTHNIPAMHGLVASLTSFLGAAPGVGTILAVAAPLLLDTLTGVITGGVLLFFVIKISSFSTR
ncbi:MAG: DUF808 domain-containing protein [Magnetococcales bacterium]|nr:DUF808 domain-containing protein [Magnetococcales bacterium]MBF0321612.1 DUF808 domain-containing protein [Magnetococcales bacterium]